MKNTFCTKKMKYYLGLIVYHDNLILFSYAIKKHLRQNSCTHIIIVMY